MNLLISACLLGISCRYDGRSEPLPQLDRLLQSDCHLVPICPEILGGLPTPRAPSERRGNRVVAWDGRDVTENDRRGAPDPLHLRIAQRTQPILRLRPHLRRHVHRHTDRWKRRCGRAAAAKRHPCIRRKPTGRTAGFHPLFRKIKHSPHFPIEFGKYGLCFSFYSFQLSVSCRPPMKSAHIPC